MILFIGKKIPDATHIEIDGTRVRVAVRVSARARNYRLTIPHHGGPVLTLPSNGRWSDAEAFLQRQNGWLAARLKRVGSPVSFAHGAVVPLRGIDHILHATGRIRGRVEASHMDGAPVLLVPGEPAHQARRLIDWFKQEAQVDLEARCAIHAARLGVTVKSVTMRGQTTRWGSCSSAGRLNFNWRLVLTPPHVLDYVAAHEVAHLVEMNHSQAFWDTVERTLPTMAAGRAWLKAHGSKIMAYGASA